MADELLPEDSLKSAIWYTISKIIEEEELVTGSTCSENFAGALSELVYRSCRQLARDTEAFAHHANRTTVNAEDVLLVARNNDALYQHLRKYASEHGLSFKAASGLGTKGKRTSNEDDDADDEPLAQQVKKAPRLGAAKNKK